MVNVLEIEHAIAQLPEIDRSYLAKKLLRSFDVPEQLSQEDKQLLDRRSAEMTDRKVTPLSLAELKKRLSPS